MLLNHCFMTVFSLKKRMNEWMNDLTQFQGQPLRGALNTRGFKEKCSQFSATVSRYISDMVQDIGLWLYCGTLIGVVSTRAIETVPMTLTDLQMRNTRSPVSLSGGCIPIRTISEQLGPAWWLTWEGRVRLSCVSQGARPHHYPVFEYPTTAYWP